MLSEVLPDIVSEAVLHGELDAIMLHIRNRDRVGGYRDPRPFAAIVVGLFLIFRRRDIRDENIAPTGDRSGNDVLDIQHLIWKLFFENPRLHFRGQLGRHQLIQDSISCPRGPRGEP